MHFRQSPSETFITAQFPNPKTHNLTPSNVSIKTHHIPETIEEVLAFSNQPPPRESTARHPNASQPRAPLQRSNSLEWWMEIRKTPGGAREQEPRSRKTSFATIVTDATTQHPAFESDAFAVHMPTTREPIMEAISAPAFRARLPKPSPSQVDAYHKQQERERERAKREAEAEYRRRYIPTKVVSHDYAYRDPVGVETFPELDAVPPASPPLLSTGAFPVSPPVPQHSFSARRQQRTVDRSVSDSSNVTIPRKPVGIGPDYRTTTRQKYQGDVQAGAMTTPPRYYASPSNSPTKDDKIKVRLKPKAATVQDPPQKESWWGLYTRSSSPQSSTSTNSTSTSTSTSPTKTAFVYPNKDTAAPTPRTSPSKRDTVPKAKSPPPAPKPKGLASRFAWLRPSGPRATNKPTTAPNSAPIPTQTSYIDPFTLHATPIPTSTNTPTPTPSRSPSPKKLIRVNVVPPLPPHSTHYSPSSSQQAKLEKAKVETGLSQLASLTWLLIKIALFLYLLVGLYYVLDAVREAMHALGAPVRAGRWVGGWVWVGGKWVGKYAVRGWERWGVRVVRESGGGGFEGSKEGESCIGEEEGGKRWEVGGKEGGRRRFR